MTLKQINSKLKKAYTGNDWMYEYSLDLVSKQKTLCYGITFEIINDCVVFFKNDLYLGPYGIESVLEWNDSVCLHRDKSNEINLEYLFILWLKKYILENNEN